MQTFSRDARIWLPAVIALLVGVLSTGLLTRALLKDAQKQDQERFEFLKTMIIELLDSQVEKYEAGIASLQEFFTFSPFPTQDQWRFRVHRMNLPLNYRGIVEVGYAPLVYASQLIGPQAKYGHVIHGEHFLTSEASPPERSYQPILYRQPVGSLPKQPLGVHLMDLVNEPATSDSRKRDEAAVTGAFEHETDADHRKETVFRLIASIYQNGYGELYARSISPTNKTQSTFNTRALERDKTYRGAVFATISFDRLLEPCFHSLKLDVGFDVFDGPDPLHANQLNHSFGAGNPSDLLRRPDLMNRVSTWRMYGKDWSVRFFPKPSFNDNSPGSRIWLISCAGVLLSVCLSVVLFVQAKRTVSAEEHTQELAEARDTVTILSKERQNISRDLHDGVMQSLFGLGLAIRRGKHLLRNDPSLAESHLDKTMRDLDLVMAEVRSHLSRAQPHDPGDLRQSLLQLCESASRQGPTKVDLEMVDAANPLVSQEVTMHLLQIAREAISNARRHSGAFRIHVELSQSNGTISLSVSDNGNGFKRDPLGPGTGNGLKNMQSRATDLGGTIAFGTNKFGGVTVTATIPDQTAPDMRQGEEPSSPQT